MARVREEAAARLQGAAAHERWRQHDERFGHAHRRRHREPGALHRQPQLSPRRPILAAALAPACLGALATDTPAEVMELGRIDVVGTTPLPGLGTPLANVPANVQVFGARGMERQRPIALPDFLERNAAATAINSSQGNAFQPDLLYRGFVASPLLGLPQGLSVFQDGVRINEPFGDVVNWDLVPQSAIASMQLVPGSAAVFGPNTLGGALAIYTKSGSQFPGGALEAYAGSFGRA